METREIRVADTKTQKSYKLMTAATTLGQLMAELRSQGIDYDGMSFTEGVSRTQLLDPNSVLPSNVPYKGGVTNNLFIVLTNTRKNIESGISRKEAYAFIKENNLQEAVKEAYGRNYTQVPTDELEKIINSANAAPCCEEQCTVANSPEVPEVSNMALALYDFIKAGVKAQVFNLTDVEVAIDLLKELANIIKENTVTLTDEDAERILASL